VDPHGELVGVLTLSDLITGLSEHGSEALVASVMERRFVVAHPAEMLNVAMARLQECACRTIPILDDDGKVVGLVTTDNIGELMMVRDAIRISSRKRPMIELAA
jgi:stage IV sporulation protein FB